MKSVIASLVAVAGLSAAAVAEVNTRMDVLVSLDGINWSSDVNVAAPGTTVQVLIRASYIGSAQPLEPGTHLAIKLVLMPQALGMLLRAVVVHSQPREDGQFEIGTEFEAPTDAQRQLLARHILQKQAQQRREARERSSPSA